MSYQPPPNQHYGPPQPPPPGQWGVPPRPPKKSKLVPILIGLGAFIIALGIIGAIVGPGTKTSGAAGATPVATNMPTTAPPSTATQAAPADPKPTATTDVTPVPRFVGMGLQAAQDAAQAKGFYVLASHDSSGRGRMQILDRDWKVCVQKPAAGTKAPLDTTLDFGAVKLEEACPTADQAPPAKAGKTMPDFTGKGLNTATAALPSDASITSTDASSQGRMILVESNWKVCTQDPKAGTPLNGQPVAFGAVKFGESCP